MSRQYQKMKFSLSKVVKFPRPSFQTYKIIRVVGTCCTLPFTECARWTMEAISETNGVYIPGPTPGNAIHTAVTQALRSPLYTSTAFLNLTGNFYAKCLATRSVLHISWRLRVVVLVVHTCSYGGIWLLWIGRSGYGWYGVNAINARIDLEQEIICPLCLIARGAEFCFVAFLACLRFSSCAI